MVRCCQPCLIAKGGKRTVGSDVISIETIKKKAIPILKNYPVEKAILFESYTEGKATVKSDIDLYIDTNGKLKGLDFVGLLETLVNAFGISLDLIERSHINPDSLIIKEIENKGIVIYEKSNPGVKCEA